ncbi:MAG: ABC transporter permease, partial [Actinomycetales bacterium]|nr:ABC transporter permease [Actinomycetales bacterium]
MNRRLAPWVAALRIARRQALRAKGRTALSAVMVGLPLLLIAAVLVLLPSMTPTEATTVRYALGETAQAHVELDPGCVPLSQMPNNKNSGLCGGGLDEHGNEVSDGEPLTPESTEALLAELVPGAQLATRWDLEATLPLPTGNGLDLSVRTLDTTGELASTVLVIEGETPKAAGEVGLSVAVADRYGFTVGDRLDLEIDGVSSATTITALLSDSDTSVLAAPGTVPIETASPSWYVLGDEPVTWSDIVVLNRGGAFVMSRDVLENPPAPTDVPFLQISAGWGGDSTQAAAGVGIVVALALLEVVLLVGPAFAVGARRQSRSLALVAATGGTRKDLRRIVLANGVVVGVGASVLAVALGVLGAMAATAWPYRDPYAIFPNLVVPPYVAGLVAVGTLVAVVAAWIPARQASRLDVVAALAGRRADATPRATTGVAGLVVAAVGVPLGAYGGYIGSSLLAGAGGVLVVLGLVAASGLLITAIGRLARRTGVATRIALRDLARQRGRTAPAVAAVLGAIAAATAGAVYTAAEAQHHEASWRPEAAMDVVKVRLSPWESTASATPEDAAAVTAAIQRIDPGAEVATLQMALPSEPPEEG